MCLEGLFIDLAIIIRGDISQYMSRTLSMPQQDYALQRSSPNITKNNAAETSDIPTQSCSRSAPCSSSVKGFIIPNTNTIVIIFLPTVDHL